MKPDAPVTNRRMTATSIVRSTADFHAVVPEVFTRYDFLNVRSRSRRLSVMVRTGRPRAFDTQKALARARDVFWSRGYGATSVQDLVDELGRAAGQHLCRVR